MPQIPSKFIDPEQVSIDSRWFNQADEYKGNIQVDGEDDAHQWEIEFLTTPLTPEDKRELNAILNAQKGRQGVFTLPDLLPYMSADTSYNVDTAHAKGDEVINVKNLSATAKVGDFINISSHSKTYQIYAATVSSISIVPPLQQAVIDNEIITPAVFTVRMKSDVNTLELDGKKYQSKQVVALMEVI